MSEVTTIAKMIFVYEGKRFKYEYDFDGNYPSHSAWYMFHEGNYSCDCNRSGFICSRYGNFIPQLPCGHTIKMRKFKVFKRPVTEPRPEWKWYTKTDLDFFK